MICTTLNKIREHGPCAKGWQKLLKHLGKTEADDEPLPLLTVLDSNGLDDALWCLRAVPEHSALWRHYAVDCAERVAHLLTDKRISRALRVARRHAMGQATDKELAAARAAARAAAWAAVRAAAWAAARDAARAAAMAASMAAAGAARDAAMAAAMAAAGAARDAAMAAEEAWQTARLRKLLTDGAWSPVEGQV
jgi:hypothetical protein